MAEYTRATHAISSSELELNAALACNREASAEFERIMCTIRDAGCLMFSDTTSLKNRFTKWGSCTPLQASALLAMA